MDKYNEAPSFLHGIKILFK